MTGPGAKATREDVAKLQLTVENGPHPGLKRTEVARRIRAMVDLLQLQKLEISFLITDDSRIHELNKVYRNKDRPTDVLAFAMREGEHAELAGDVLGDVIVSVQTARRQASERGVELVDELTMLLAHGLLHLLGWDHATAAQDRSMRAETDRLCRAAAPSPARTTRKATAKKRAASPARPRATARKRSVKTRAKRSKERG